jgi:hypothetical protein
MTDVRTATIECHIGKANSAIETPSGFVGGADFLHHHFFNGSNGVINLVPRNRLNEGSFVDRDVQAVDAIDLNFALERLAGNPPGATRVSRIAVILAGLYGPHPNVFGIMFDPGRRTGADNQNATSPFDATPREGCAIFIDAIRQLRPNLSEFDKEIEYTTVHELGHIFNLDHLASPPSFMASSPMTHSHEDDHFHFTLGQRNWLGECATNRWVYPGGSPYEPVSAENSPFRRPALYSATPKVELRIGIENAVFACAAPVEMDVSLTLAADSVRALRILDRLDPGYDEFAVWITYPNGDRNRYRSPRRYCTPPARLTLKPGQSLARDISIFSGARGTTFFMPGIYHLRAEFDLGARGRVVSNEVVVEAVANSRLLMPERTALLADPRVRALLYHRRQRAGENALRQLSKHLQEHPDGVGANDLRYALVRAHHRRNTKNSTSQTVRDEIRRIWATPGTLGIRQHYHLQSIYDAVAKRSSRDNS